MRLGLYTSLISAVLIFISVAYLCNLTSTLKHRTKELESMLQDERNKIKIIEIESKKQYEEIQKASVEANEQYQKDIKSGYSILKANVSKGCDKAMAWGLVQAKIL